MGPILRALARVVLVACTGPATHRIGGVEVSLVLGLYIRGARG